jgi:hypothetical protein
MYYISLPVVLHLAKLPDPRGILPSQPALNLLQLGVSCWMVTHRILKGERMHNSAFAEFPRGGPRLCGVQEHSARSKWFLQLAQDSHDAAAKYRFALAGIYSARAVIEIMLEAAERQELKAYQNADPKQSRKDLEASLVPDLPLYYLIENIRIHDFHRFGCVPPNPRLREVFFGGPVKLVARQGVAGVAVPTSGPRAFVSGQSQVKEQRPLCQDDGRFFDDTSGQYLHLHEILDRFLAGMSAVVSRFESLATA